MNEKIILSELYRNLGDFDKYIWIVKSIDNPEMNWLKNAFYA